MSTLRYPPNVQWEVTTECNHNCIHCYNYWRKDSEVIKGMSKFNSEQQYLAIAQKLIEQNPVSVVITGGEPLIVFDKIKSSIDLMLKHGIFVSINTNAALLTAEMVKYLSERRIGLFVSLPCSNTNICDYITSSKNSCSQIIEKLDLAYSHNIPFSTNIVVSKLNIDYIKETVEFLKNRYNISKVSITRVGKPINSDDTFNQYLLNSTDICTLQKICVDLYNQLSIKVETSCPYTACSIYSQEAFELFGYSKICTAGKTSYAIDTDGNVKACPRDSQLYGNLLESNFDSIWAKLHKWRDDTYLPEECKNCKSLSKCLGGCRVDSLPFTGKLDQLDTISNPANLPIRYTKTPSNVNETYSENDIFIVSHKVRYTFDNNSIRASVGRTYLFLTEPLYEFINKNNKFSLKDLSNYFHVDYTTANNVVKTLVSNNIINKS